MTLVPRMRPEEFEIFITCVPGLEDELLNEIQELGCKKHQIDIRWR